MTTALKTEIQARINAATIANTSTELALLRLMGAELGCDLTQLDIVALALANNNASGVSLIELAKRVRAQPVAEALGGNKSGTHIGGVAFFTGSTPHDYMVEGERYLKGGFIETDVTKFNPALFKMSLNSVAKAVAITASQFSNYIVNGIAASDTVIVGVTGLGYDNENAAVAPKALYSVDGGASFLSAPIAGFGTTYTPKDVAYGAGLFVAVGNGGRISTSPNGQVWTLRSSGIATSVSFERVMWNGSAFIAVAGTSVWRSVDGITWGAVTTGLTSNITQVTFDLSNPNTWVVGATSGTNGIAVSTDNGQTWALKSISNTGYVLSALTYGAGVFYSVSGIGVHATNDLNVSWVHFGAVLAGVKHVLYDPVNDIFVTPEFGVTERFISYIRSNPAAGFSNPQKILRYGDSYFTCGGNGGAGIQRVNAIPYAGSAVPIETASNNSAKGYVRIS